MRIQLISYRLNGSTGITRPAPTPGGIPWTSTEVFCAFPDALNFIDAILEYFDAATNREEYPLGYISLRLCGSSAGLGDGAGRAWLKRRHDRSGHGDHP